MMRKGEKEQRRRGRGERKGGTEREKKEEEIGEERNPFYI